MLKNTSDTLLAEQSSPLGGLSSATRTEDNATVLQIADSAAEAAALNHFVCNSKNAFPVKIMHAIASDRPGSQYGKVLLTGKSGTGKSHLLQAMVSLMAMSVEKSRIVCDNALHFLHDKNALSCRSFWDQASVIMLDDIQDLVPEMSCQESLVALMESCPPSCQLVLVFSGDSALLQRFGERLATRLGDCLALNLLEADLDVRVRFMEVEARRLALDIDHQTVIYLAQHCRDIAAVRGILQKIQAFTAVHKRRMSHNDMVNILHTGKTGDVPEHRAIINRVAKSMGIRAEDILGDKRRQNVVQARQLSMYICRKSLGLSFPELGKLFGGKDHSTVVYSVNKIQKMIDSNKEMQNLVTQLSNYAA